MVFIIIICSKYSGWHSQISYTYTIQQMLNVPFSIDHI